MNYLLINITVADTSEMTDKRIFYRPTLAMTGLLLL